MGSDRPDWTRREWLWLVASGTLGGTALVHGRGARPWGVQVYTVRKQLEKQPAETFREIAAIGYKEVELYGSNLDTWVPLAKQAGLMPVSTHIENALVLDDTPQDALDKAFDAIAGHGIKYALMAYVPPERRGKDAAAYRKFGDQMNRAAQSAKRAGLAFGYHNHAFEFGKLADGTRPLDTMLASFDPSLVRFEIDVFWVSITGNDPIALLKTLDRRVMMLHLKDKAKGVPVQFDEDVKPTVFTEVGSGTVDMRAILKTARAIGVEHYFVEQDETPGDPLASLKKSYEYLSRQS